MTAHVHRAHWAPDGVPGTGLIYERCKCGAVRRLDFRGMVGELGEPKASAWSQPVMNRLTKIVRRAKVAVLGVLLFAAGGCAGGALPTKPIADARKLVDATDKPIADLDHALVGVGSGLLAIEPVLLAVCTGTAPPLPEDKCGPALKGYDAAQAGHDIAVEALAKGQEALVAVDAALATIEAVAEALQ